MSKLIISRMEIRGILCDYTALINGNRLLEFHFQPVEENSILNNIYVGKVEKLAPSINAAFVRVQKDLICYYNYAKEQSDGRKLKVGEEILVQVSAEAMKEKLPTVTGNLSFRGNYLVLTSGKRGLGLSSKLNAEQKKTIKDWFSDMDFIAYGLIVRTNAAQAAREQVMQEFDTLRKRYETVMEHGKTRTVYSVLERQPSFCIRRLQDTYTSDLEEVICDIPEVYSELSDFIQEKQNLGHIAENPDPVSYHVRFYEDPLLPLRKLYSIETHLHNLLHEKVWLKSGGFLMIQPTEALVSIDVNTGKYIEKKKAEETYLKINLEAAREIALQLRARNLSGIILIDFINMKSKEHEHTLLQAFRKYLSEDTVPSRIHGMTALKLVEITRKKVEKPLHEKIREL